MVLKINNRTNDDNVGMHSPALEKIIRTKYEMFGKICDAPLKQIHKSIFSLFLDLGGVMRDSTGAAQNHLCDFEIGTVDGWSNSHDCQNKPFSRESCSIE